MPHQTGKSAAEELNVERCAHCDRHVSWLLIANGYHDEFLDDQG